MNATQRRVIFEEVTPERVTAGGIVLQSTSDQRTHGRIVSIGPRVEEAIQVGDVIIVDWSKTVPLGRNSYFVIDERNIMGVLE
jgi:co-chaperonin GroES (HSP10)